MSGGFIPSPPLILAQSAWVFQPPPYFGVRRGFTSSARLPRTPPQPQFPIRLLVSGRRGSPRPERYASMLNQPQFPTPLLICVRRGPSSRLPNHNFPFPSLFLSEGVRPPSTLLVPRHAYPATISQPPPYFCPKGFASPTRLPGTPSQHASRAGRPSNVLYPHSYFCPKGLASPASLPGMPP